MRLCVDDQVSSTREALVTRRTRKRSRLAVFRIPNVVNTISRLDVGVSCTVAHENTLTCVTVVYDDTERQFASLQQSHWQVDYVISLY